MILGLKFGKRKNLESLQKGSLYMNSLQFFKDMEITMRNKGIGDEKEAVLSITNISDFKVIDRETGDVFLKANEGSMDFYQKKISINLFFALLNMRFLNILMMKIQIKL